MTHETTPNVATTTTTPRRLTPDEQCQLHRRHRLARQEPRALHDAVRLAEERLEAERAEHGRSDDWRTFHKLHATARESLVECCKARAFLHHDVLTFGIANVEVTIPAPECLSWTHAEAMSRPPLEIYEACEALGVA